MASVVQWARAAAAGLAAWLAAGALALVPLTPSPGIARAGALLPAWTLPLFIGLAWMLLRATRARRLGAGAALVLAAILPWLPGPAVPALAVWSGPILLLAALVVGPAALWSHRVTDAAPSSWAPRWQAGVSAALVFVGALATAWHLAPILPGGDEPHYLVITQSLLYDGDLAIDNNHARRDYAPYFSGTLRPDFLKRGLDGRVYSIHAPGVSAFVLPAFALAGYPGVVAWLAAWAALGAWGLWLTAWRLTASTSAAWFGWSVAALSTPAFFQSFAVFPDGPAAVLVVGAIALLVRAPARAWPWMTGGLALAALPWLHTRYAVLALALGVGLTLGAWRAARLRAVLALAAFPVVSALAWFWQFYAIYGTPDPRAPYGTYTQTALRYVPRGLSGLLIDQQFGLFMYAPALALALAGLVWMCAAKGAAATGAAETTEVDAMSPVSERAVGLVIAGAVVPYALVSSAYAMWWGGASSPARFLAPVTLVLGIPAAWWWARCRRRSSHLVGVVLAALGVATTLLLAVAAGGRLAYNVRDGYALFLGWLAPTVDLAMAFPSLHRQSVAGAWTLAAPWLAVVGAGWGLARWLDGRRDPARLVPITLAAGALVVPLALATAWGITGVDGVLAAQGQHRLVQRLAMPWQRGVWLDAATGRPRALGRDEVAGRLSFGSLARAPIRDGGPLVWPELPAGDYELALPATIGHWQLGVGRDEGRLLDQSSGRIEPPATPPLDGPVEGRTAERLYRVDLPVAVHSLRLRAEGTAGDVLARARLRPQRLHSRDGMPSAAAVSAARYGGHAVFFLDDQVFVEGAAWWVRAERRASVAIVPPDSRRSVRLALRNGAVDNEVTLVSGRWRHVFRMAQGAMEEVTLPLPPGDRAVPLRITSARGFVPADVDPSSADRRALGVWCTVR